MGKHRKKRTYVTLYGHKYNKNWMIEYLQAHTVKEAMQELPGIIDKGKIYQLAKRLGIKLKKQTRPPTGPPTTLCWVCANATNGALCSWVDTATPVEGWEAKPTKIYYNESIVDSFKVIKCPIFKEGRKE